MGNFFVTRTVPQRTPMSHSRKLSLLLILTALLTLTGNIVRSQAPGGVSNGLTLWVRADSTIYSDAGTTLCTDGSTVQQWNNKPTLNPYNFTQPTAGKRPKYYTTTRTFNFNPIIEFDNTGASGNGDKLGITTLGTNLFSQTELTTFMAQRLRTTAYTQVWFKWQDCFDASCSPSDRVGFENATTNLRFDVMSNGTGSNNVGNPAGFDITTYRNVMSVWASSAKANAVYGVAQGGSRVRIDGSEGTTVTANTGTANFNSVRELALGANNNEEDTYYSNLDISEVIIYNRGLVKAERDKVDSYMGIKYGISMFHDYVSSKGVVAWNYAMNPAYNYGIIGVGRDDASGLLQKQSKSMSRLVNASLEMDIITLYLGSKTVTNQANTATFASGDTSFFIVGCNKATALASINTENAPTVIKTLNREWLAQQRHFTNNDITVEFDLSTVPTIFQGSACMKPQLLMDTDGNFSNCSIIPDSISHLVKNGTTVTITLPYTYFQATPYFTIGFVNKDDTASSVVVDPKCYGNSDGSITMNVPVGAAPPITYQLNGGAFQASGAFTGLAAGTYYPTAKDNNGCLYRDTVVLKDPADMTLVGNKIDAKCFGLTGKAYVQTIQNGFNPYTYAWDNGGTTDTTTAVAGTYKVVVTDNHGCKDSTTVTITEPTKLDIDTVVTPASCPLVFNGKIVATAAGGTTPYTYNKNTTTYTASGTFASLQTGTYMIRVKDAKGCMDSASVVVPAGDPPIVTAPNDTSICPGQKVTLSGSGTAGVTYTWNNGVSNNVAFTPNATKQYNVTGTDANGCKGTDSVIVTLLPVPNSTINPAPNPICSDTSDIQLSAATPGGLWRGPGITDATNGIFTPSAAGVGTHNIIYEVTNAGGCMDDDTIKITVTARKDARINPAGPFCTNAGVQQLTTVQPGGTWSGPGMNGGAGVNGNGKFDPAVAGAGSHVIKYSLGGTCPDIDSITILVNSIFDATIIPGGPYCATDAPVQLQSNTPGATWSGTGITDPAVGTFDPSLAGPGTYTITHAISGTCGTTDTEQFTVLPLDTVHIQLPNDSMCHNAAAVFLNADKSGGTWAGNVNSSGIFDPAGKVPGAYWIYYTYMQRCAYTDSVTITIADTLITNFPDATVPCFGDQSGSIAVTPSRGVSPYTYVWADDATETLSSRSNLPKGTYVVTVTDDLGCSLNDTAVISEPTQLQITSTSTVNDSCFQAGKGNVVAPASGGTPQANGKYNYSLAPVAGTLNANGDGFNGLKAGNYTLTVRDQNNCSVNYSFTITEPALLTVVADGSTDYCGQGIGSAQVSQTNGGSGGYIHTWNNSVSGLSNPNLSAGTYTVTVKDNLGCSANDTALVGNVAAPVITATPDSVSCWLGSDGGASTVVTGGTGTTTITWSDGLMPNATSRNDMKQGGYWVEVQDSRACKHKVNFTVAQPNDIDLTNLTGGTICYQQTYSGNFVVAGGNGAPFTYIVNGISQSSSAYSFAAGTYTIWSRDNKGCYSDTTTFTVNNSPSLSGSLSPDPTVCRYDTARFTAGGTGGNNNFTFQWDNTAPGSAINKYYPTGSTTAASTPIRLIVADGCSKPDTLFGNYLLFADPKATLGYTPNSGCYPLDVNFTVSGNLSQYEVYTGENTVYTNPAFMHTFQDKGFYHPTITGETADGCKFSFAPTQAITVYGYPTAEFSWEPEYPTIIDNRIQLINNSDPGNTYEWLGTDTVNGVDYFTSELYSPYCEMPAEIGVYLMQLVAKSGFGCTDTIVKRITVKDEILLHVPNSFSPNEDGYNEVFIPIFSTSNIARYELLIYDRWGQLIFSTKDPLVGWDGKYLGEPAQNDVYTFRLKYSAVDKASLRNVFGKITLFR